MPGSELSCPLGFRFNRVAAGPHGVLSRKKRGPPVASSVSEWYDDGIVRHENGRGIHVEPRGRGAEVGRGLQEEGHGREDAGPGDFNVRRVRQEARGKCALGGAHDGDERLRKIVGGACVAFERRDADLMKRHAGGGVEDGEGDGRGGGVGEHAERAG